MPNLIPEKKKKIRLNRYLAMCGLGARRKCDDLIAQGKIKVNGVVIIEMGVRIDPQADIVEYRGNKVIPDEDYIYILLNKPLYTVTTTSDEKKRKTVLDLVKLHSRIYPVGRLDYHTTGALLLTNDGDLAYHLAHPGFEISKIYRVLLDERIRPVDMHFFRTGIEIDRRKTSPCRVEELRVIDNCSYLEVELHEGRNRQIRRMCESLGYKVRELHRIEFAGLQLGGMKTGDWRRLTPDELKELKEKVERHKKESSHISMGEGKKIIIAIDGPAASGKSTTARRVAKRLGYIYIDSGAMYRAVTLKALRKNVPVTDEEQVARLAKNIKLDFSRASGRTVIFMDDEDVSDAVRTPEIDQKISPVAANPKVREILVKKQQHMGKDGGVVMDGMDIGTVVFPDAELKIYMIASVEERSYRRKKELEEKGLPVDLKKIKEDIRFRDDQDINRSFGPLKKAQDAVGVDTTTLTIDEQVERILELARARIETQIK